MTDGGLTIDLRQTSDDVMCSEIYRSWRVVDPDVILRYVMLLPPFIVGTCSVNS